MAERRGSRQANRHLEMAISLVCPRLESIIDIKHKEFGGVFLLPSALGVVGSTMSALGHKRT